MGLPWDSNSESPWLYHGQTRLSHPIQRNNVCLYCQCSYHNNFHLSALEIDIGAGVSVRAEAPVPPKNENVPTYFSIETYLGPWVKSVGVGV